jgi:hypothetical protein
MAILNEEREQKAGMPQGRNQGAPRDRKALDPVD